MWSKLDTIGGTGSENGTILLDEEYKESCRITLEKCARYYSITCGIYGIMVHTAFADSKSYQCMYDEMKKELQLFIDKDTTESEDTEFYEHFTSKY